MAGYERILLEIPKETQPVRVDNIGLDGPIAQLSIEQNYTKEQNDGSTVKKQLDRHEVESY